MSATLVVAVLALAAAASVWINRWPVNVDDCQPLPEHRLDTL